MRREIDLFNQILFLLILSLASLFFYYAFYFLEPEQVLPLPLINCIFYILCLGVQFRDQDLLKRIYPCRFIWISVPRRRIAVSISASLMRRSSSSSYRSAVSSIRALVDMIP